jgi:hypothetical protein
LQCGKTEEASGKKDRRFVVGESKKAANLSTFLKRIDKRLILKGMGEQAR